MDDFIVRYFGVNRLNFFGWIAAGSVVIVGSLIAMLRDQSAFAIFWVLFGIFGILLQFYCSLLAEKIDRQRKTSDQSTPVP